MQDEEDGLVKKKKGRKSEEGEDGSFYRREDTNAVLETPVPVSKDHSMKFHQTKVLVLLLRRYPNTTPLGRRVLLPHQRLTCLLHRE